MPDDFAATWDGPSVLRLEGRFDASRTAAAEEALARVDGSTVIDFDGLRYISSAGIGCLLVAHKRLGESGPLKIINPSDSIRELFELAGFDTVFEMG